MYTSFIRYYIGILCFTMDEVSFSNHIRMQTPAAMEKVEAPWLHNYLATQTLLLESA